MRIYITIDVARGENPARTSESQSPGMIHYLSNKIRPKFAGKSATKFAGKFRRTFCHGRVGSAGSWEGGGLISTIMKISGN